MTRKEFIFNNTVDEIIPFMEMISGFLRSHYGNALSDQRISMLRLALIETLTNGIKHSGVRYSLIEFHLYDQWLEVIKTDRGNVFRNDVFTQWPMPEECIGRESVIYISDFNKLIARLVSASSMEFIAQDLQELNLTLDSITLRNYGLLIIAKISDRFTYTYSHSTGENIFSFKVHI